MNNPETSIIDLAKGLDSPAPPEAAAQVTTNQNVPSVEAEAAPVVGSTAELKALVDSLLMKTRTKQAWISVDLPSKGLQNIPALNIKLRPFRYEDERKLRAATSLSESTEVLEELMNSCMQGGSLRDVTLADKNFILYKLRELSYGNEYNVNADCASCASMNSLTVKLGDLECKRATEDMHNPRRITLPDAEVHVDIRELMARDERTFNNPEDLTENLWKIVESVQGHNDRMVIQAFLKECSARDISFLRNNIFESRMGLENTVKFRCNSCSHEQVIELPITEDFFSAS